MVLYCFGKRVQSRKKAAGSKRVGRPFKFVPQGRGLEKWVYMFEVTQIADSSSSKVRGVGGIAYGRYVLRY